jgi:hypothetical protein
MLLLNCVTWSIRLSTVDAYGVTMLALVVAPP